MSHSAHKPTYCNLRGFPCITWSSLLRLNSIVPFAMEGISEDVERRQFFISHLESCRVGGAILEGSDGETLLSGGMREQFQHHFKRGKRSGPPVDGNEGKEAMLNRIPFAGGGRIMSHRDRELFLIGQVLQLLLPQSISHSIGTTPVSGDEQLLFVRVELLATSLPPSADALHSKLGRVMVNADVDKAAVVNQIIHPVGDSLAIGEGKKVIHIHLGLLPFGLPLPPMVLKIAQEFLLLTVD